jgi:hypothetical protein
MPSWIRALCIVVLLTPLGFSQSAGPDTIRRAYAIVTPESGNASGLIPTETLIHRTASGIVETSLSPSPVLSNLAMPVNFGTLTDGSTGIAIVNPSAVAANVEFSITDSDGTQILVQTFTVLPHSQLSRFLNELFAEQVTSVVSRSGLLTIAADVPVAAIGLNFRDAGFAAQPFANMTNPVPLTSFTSSIDPQNPTVASPVVGVLAISAPSVGGSAAFIFPQVVNGGGWSTSISLANTSTASQTVRIDFFDPNGLALRTVSGITIPSRGLYNLVQ